MGLMGLSFGEKSTIKQGQKINNQKVNLAVNLAKVEEIDMALASQIFQQLQEGRKKFLGE